MPQHEQRTDQPDLSNLLEGYAVPKGTADELFDASGTMRPVWHPFLSYLNGLGPARCESRFHRGNQYLRDMGVFFRRYSTQSGEDRDWPLSHVPVLLHDSDWAQIETGLIQRANLLERVVADIYGPQRLVRNGQLPAELLAQNPEWLRPMVGIRPRSGQFLQHLAFELGRNPDGSWFVLGDRTQAPSGAGFALENRRASAHMYSDFFPDTNVHRLAGFFRRFRDALRGMSDGDTLAILTPGPNNDAYFEHVFIARYLGLMLLEGEDLTVHNGQAMVRTVSGLKPVSMLWRRMDAQFADPLELNEASRIGTPGMVSAIRSGSLALSNALGSGVLETRALMAFLPRLSEILLGQPLQLPNIATWWCGDPQARAYVQKNIHKLALAPALATGLPHDSNISAMGPTGISGEAQPDNWDGTLVGQEAVSLSTTPCYENGRLVPRPMVLRVFLARTPTGWAVMPGGYARIGPGGENSALSMQQGGSVADVWVVSDTDVPRDPLVPNRDTYQRVLQGALPSRAADNLFWLGRYVERAESTIRLIRSYHRRISEGEPAHSRRLQHLAAHLDRLGVDLEQDLPDVLRDQISAATHCASKVRDRFSVDAWVALSDLNRTLAGMTKTVRAGDDCARAMSVLLRKLSGFGGLVLENMYRSSGWRFLEFGRALERAITLNDVLQSFTATDAPNGSLDLAIEYGDSISTHQRLFLVDPNRYSVLDLMLLDLSNPRSVLFQIDILCSLVPDLPLNPDHTAWRETLLRQITAVQQFLTGTRPEGIEISDFDDIRQRLFELSTSLSSIYMR
ncbi:hypothetical protein TG4357_01748 [Thalassovita gelatinovora]|uniref:Uncharacterized protein n=1 Tax=Thalassovita gelatinovora TaxID=53501 RepID=A0A0N7LV40_THAGE|nr:circularly permuted type 2 ATP-grasp protein [Thalassovita gelatinovora]QIZ80669.1 circularly permuted type 2 ATP-grasp protein [Thalassovita gelatinovora]CUH65234.1 hypothetical protein TG4357_01748 [Thalassovita gelatinovora]SEQ88020.1 Uncharacterized conserved protein, circularly permuted ATPgrasp superfamily [Thalassovita gelatinovora]